MKSSNRSLWLYYKEISKVPLLTPQEEKLVATRAKAGDKAALQTLIESNLRFVVTIAKRFEKAGLPLLEMINEGNIGLMEAARRFDPERNVRFTSYAVWWIKQKIYFYIANSAGIVRLPSRIAIISYRINQALSKRTDAENRIADDQEFAASMGVSLERLRIGLAARTRVHSIDEPMSDESKTLVSDELAQKIIPSPEASLVSNSMKKKIKESIRSLSVIERKIVRLRFGLDDDNPLTLVRIGKQLKLSRERIRQIEKQALLKMRRSSASLAAFLN